MKSKTIIISNEKMTARGILTLSDENDLLNCKIRLYGINKLTPSTKIGIYHGEKVYSANLIERNNCYHSSLVGDFNLDGDFFCALVETNANNTVLLSGGTYAGYYFNGDSVFENFDSPEIPEPSQFDSDNSGMAKRSNDLEASQTQDSFLSNKTNDFDDFCDFDDFENLNNSTKDASASMPAIKDEKNTNFNNKNFSSPTNQIETNDREESSLNQNENNNSNFSKNLNNPQNEPQKNLSKYSDNHNNLNDYYDLSKKNNDLNSENDSENLDLANSKEFENLNFLDNSNDECDLNNFEKFNKKDNLNASNNENNNNSTQKNSTDKTACQLENKMCENCQYKAYFYGESIKFDLKSHESHESPIQFPTSEIAPNIVSAPIPNESNKNPDSTTASKISEASQSQTLEREKETFSSNESEPSPVPTSLLKSIEAQFDYVFENYAPNTELTSRIENSRFAKMNTGETESEYSIGAIYFDASLKTMKYICYAVKTHYNTPAPDELGTHHQWLPLDPEDPLSDGYYIVYQDASDLKIIEI